MKPVKWMVTMVLLPMSLLACSDGTAEGDVGAACTANEHCAEGLICDVHDADDGMGTCQVPHDH